jgi:hypothetical protein
LKRQRTNDDPGAPGLEPEALKAFRDTWELGFHSCLTHLRDRLKSITLTENQSGNHE